MNLTTKELSSLEDQLDSEQVLIKKYKSYAVMSNDPAIKTKFENFASQHQNHYNTLLGYLR